MITNKTSDKVTNINQKLKLHTLFKFKDSLDQKIRSDSIYRYTCRNCNLTYYGKTYRHFFTKAAEHMGISNLTEKRVKNMKQFLTTVCNVIASSVLTPITLDCSSKKTCR